MQAKALMLVASMKKVVITRRPKKNLLLPVWAGFMISEFSIS